MMFERFTDRARRVVVLAQEESQRLSHNYIGTEHLLLGLLAEREGVAARALESLNVTLTAAREQVEEIVGLGEQHPQGHIPFTPRAKKILELSLREALTTGSQVIDTQHLLLGLVDEGDGVGAQILQRLGATAQAVRETVVRLINAEPEAAEVTGPGSEPTAVPVTQQVRIRVDALTEVKDLLLIIELRLSAIERHLGIDAGREEPPAGPTQADAEAEAEAE
jgi:ATP-dependent Clp protease ATP-binding subunit ClpC